MKRILFIVDHKHRDLAASALIGFYLKKDGYEVAYCAPWHEDKIVKEFSPNIIVLPKPIYKNHIFASWKINDIKVAVNDVEGNLQQKEFGFLKPKIFPDLYLYWNDIFFQRQGEYFKKTHNQYTGSVPERVLAGCPRIDFLHPKFESVNKSRKELLSELNIPKNKKIITIATAGSSADLSDEDLQKIQENVNSRNSNPPDIFLEASIYRELREMTVQIVEKAALELNNFHFVLKPHPNEIPKFWLDIIEKQKLKNITIMKSGTINDLLNLSHIHMAHNVCTSTFEAMIKKIPTIEMQTDRSQIMFSEKDLKLPLFPVQNSKEAIEAVNELESSREKFINKGFLKAEDFCEKWYGKFDGKRCLEYAESIKKLSNKKILISKLSKTKMYFKFIFGNGISKLMERFQKLSIKKIFEKVKGIKQKDWTDERHDKTIQPGDEKFWFEKFEKIIND